MVSLLVAHRVLHILAQRPGRTGSGVTLDALVERAELAGWEQAVVCAAPASEPQPEVGGLPRSRIEPLLFETEELDFAIPGMSDVMPYPSRRYSSLTTAEVDRYEAAWKRHIASAIAGFRPELLHIHHLWLVSALARDVAPDLPIVVHCHGTGLRQMALAPQLAPRARRCARNDQILALHQLQRDELIAELGIEPSRVTVVGAGYRDELFHDRDRREAVPPRILYAGKYSQAKGLPWLLDAVERIAKRREIVIEVAGTGTGVEADRLRRRMEGMAPTVLLHGQLDQASLADRLRGATLFVLPSMFEGLPLVTIEAAACGCRLVCTDLPGVRELASGLEGLLELVPLPRLVGPDQPLAADLPRFVDALEAAIDRVLGASSREVGLAERLRPFTWDAVFTRVAAVWEALLAAA